MGEDLTQTLTVEQRRHVAYGDGTTPWWLLSLFREYQDRSTNLTGSGRSVGDELEVREWYQQRQGDRAVGAVGRGDFAVLELDLVGVLGPAEQQCPRRALDDLRALDATEVAILSASPRGPG